MSKMQHLSAVDGAFLHLETAEMPMHVGSLHHYQLPEGYQGNWYEDVKAHLSKRLHLAPVFTRKLALMPFDLANPVWIEDDDIDLDYHIRHTVLPKPGTRAQLEALAARLHSSLLDRSRPLWEFYVIEGLADGTMGFYCKVHHAAIDGQAGVALGNAMLDVTPVPRSVKPPRAPRTHRYQLGMAELLGAALSNTLQQVRMLGKLALPLGRTLLDSAREALAERSFSLASVRKLLTMAPPTPFNASITNQRVFATLTLPLDEAKRLGKAHGASINDLVLWLCSTALREYLKESRELPEASLVAGVPVSLRAEGDTRMNNQVTMNMLEVATDEADPLERLSRIRTATASMKNTMGAFGDLIPTDFPSPGAPWLLSGLVSLYGRSGLADRIRVSNVTISNVPGSAVPLYLAGAKMLDYYPVSIAVHGVALNITVQSYMGQLCFGLIACRRAVPDVRDIAVNLQRAFDRFKQLPLPEAAAPPLKLAAAAPPEPAAKRVADRAADRAAKRPVKRPARKAAAAPAKAPRKAKPTLRVVAKAPARRRAARRAES
ncbi:MAG TPA: wax ester/triacylglycerol synthase family O-acyltransferase [Rubrivivax sp.]|nr:wax ester/triacylglycerol synthase family O-acyltransferase [Rubrivivax sp.]